MLLNVKPNIPRDSGDRFNEGDSSDLGLPPDPKREVPFRFPKAKQTTFRCRRVASFEKLSASLPMDPASSDPRDQTTSSKRYLRAQSSDSMLA